MQDDPIQNHEMEVTSQTEPAGDLFPQPEPEGIPPEILAKAEEWTAHAVKPEAASPDTDECDLYSLWAAMVSLTQETKLQGRAFKELSETIKPTAQLTHTIPDVLAAQESALKTLGNAAADCKVISEAQKNDLRQVAAHQAQAETLEMLLEIRDRLCRGLMTARIAMHNMGQPVKPNPLARFFGAKDTTSLFKATENLLTGYELSLQRLEGFLREMGVCEISCNGLPFDPQTMAAVDIETTSVIPTGMVLEVYRTGYTWGNEVFRVAEVKVAKNIEDANEQ